MADKINKKDIASGLNAVAKIMAGVTGVPDQEASVPAEKIHFMVNPYNKNDTKESVEALAKSIEFNGLINRVSLNERPDGEYDLVSGERRYRAMTEVLGWELIPARVSRVSINLAKSRQHTANLEVREYDAAEKLGFYEDMTALLREMKESGEFTGAIQQTLAEMLGITVRQVRKYQEMARYLSPEQKQAISTGSIPIELGYRQAQEAKLDKKDLAEKLDQKTREENGVRVSAPPVARPTVTTSVQDLEDENRAREERKQEAMRVAGAEHRTASMLRAAVLQYYKKQANEIFFKYTIELLTPTEAIREFIRPETEQEGAAVKFEDGTVGKFVFYSDHSELFFGSQSKKFSLTSVDEAIRQLIQEYQWIDKSEILGVLRSFL